jgi:biotin carboxyl carrier protein
MSDKTNNKVVKIKRNVTVNAATILIAAVLVYIVACMISAARKKPIATYKVNKSDVSNDIILDGVIIRDEQVINSNAAGYICYFVRDGEKIKNNATICTIDQTGQIHSVLSEGEGYEDVLTQEDYIDIRDSISLYKVNYSNDSFYEAYNFESSINNKVLELTNEILMQQLSASGSTSISTVNSPASGLVTYYVDGYEDFDINNISAAMFDKSEYKKETLKTGDMISAGDPVVKVIPSETWYVVAPITNEQIAMLNDDEYVTINLNNSNYNMTMPYEIVYGMDGNYIKVTISKYMSNFISERFISMEIILEEETGLKVPVSAIVDKDVYVVPNEYLSAGGNQSSENSLLIQTTMEDGTESVERVTVTIYKSVDETSYIDTNGLEPSDVILKLDESDGAIAVSTLPTDQIQGVYSATRGTAEFRMINVKKMIDEFALIESGEEVSEYDNIILDSSQITENQILY